MGLLFLQLSKNFHSIADRVYVRQFEIDQRLESEYNDYRRKKMYEDILYNLSFLDIAHRYQDSILFNNYALWLLQLMVSLMPDLTNLRVKEQMVTHYQLLKEALYEHSSSEEYASYEKILDRAIDVTNNASEPIDTDRLGGGKYGVIRRTYLNLLLKSDASGSMKYINDLAFIGLSLEEIFVDVLQEVMKEIGELWHRAIITVDQEHYMTSMTQVVMSQFYTRIFGSKRNGMKLLCCTVGSELHEMGARMVSDLFENNGWDSIYLGAALPTNQILHGIRNHRPHLVALSVTMPHHLIECETVVKAIKAEFPELQIAVGGRAFEMTNQIWKKWPVDTYALNAKEFLDWSKSHIGKTANG
jgi:MerR family transcriptional regulator, light-induced transcriptional regulator